MAELAGAADSKSAGPKIRGGSRQVSVGQGTARVKGHTITLSGAYGSDGLPCMVLDAVYEAGIELPSVLVELWNKGEGWNSAGNEAPAMRAWALKTFGR